MDLKKANEAVAESGYRKKMSTENVSSLKEEM